MINILGMGYRGRGSMGEEDFTSFSYETNYYRK